MSCVCTGASARHKRLTYGNVMADTLRRFLEKRK